jgi:1-acyl-sn-glycerol-3-phosphate acyltransferase
MPQIRRLIISEAIVASLLAVISLTFALGAPHALPLHAAMLVGFAAVCTVARWRKWSTLIDAAAIVIVLMQLYQTVAEPAFVAMHGGRDAALARVDRLLFLGRDPALLAQRFATPGVIEAFSLVYGIFIPYLWFSIILGCIGRPDHERQSFLLGLSITYALAYLGYLFVPSRGPIEWYHFAGPLPHGPLHDLVLRSVDMTGGNHGAFPSLHVGASAYLCLFDLRRNPVRGMTYVPIVILIAMSTVMLRYHYVIDVVSGLTIALIAAAVALPEGRRGRLPHTLFGLFAKAGVGIYFDRMEIEGVENVPSNGPLLVVSNHTNGLADGLVVTAALPRRLSMTAKSTLKKNPLLAFVMWFADAVPFYRRQDDVDVRKNVDSFVEIRRRLARGGAICIFPEGVSHSDASLREFRSGAARIALDFAAQHRGLRILPVGLQYGAKQRLRSPVWVRFGECIDVDAMSDGGRALSPPELTHEIETRIRALSANFRSVREALWLRWTAELLETRGDDPRPLDQERVDYPSRARLLESLRADYERIERDRVAGIVNDLRGYRRDLRRLAIAQHEVYLSMNPFQAGFFAIRELELLIIGSVIAAIGLVQNGLGLLADRVLTKKLSVDLDHWASNAIFYGFAIFPIVWIAGIAIVAALASWKWAIVYAVSAPFTLVYDILFFDRGRRAFRRARTFLRFLFRRDLQRGLQARGRALIAAIQNARRHPERSEGPGGVGGAHHPPALKTPGRPPELRLGPGGVGGTTSAPPTRPGPSLRSG